MPATNKATRRMNMPEIRMKATALGLIPGKMHKTELIHAIQVAENCTPCFGKSGGPVSLCRLLLYERLSENTLLDPLTCVFPSDETRRPAVSGDI